MEQVKVEEAVKKAGEQFLAEMKPVLEVAVKNILEAALTKGMVVVVGSVVAATENKIDDAFFSLVKDEAEKQAKELIAQIKF